MLKRLLLFFMLLTLCGVPAPAGAVEVGKPAPAFILETLDGKQVSLADFKGKVVVLKLATTWCPSCGHLTRELAAAGDVLKEQGAVLIEVFLQDTPEMVERYLKGQSFPMAHVVLLDDMSAYRAYGVYLIPRLLVLDKEQTIRYDNGASAAVPPAAEIKKIVEGVLAGKP